MKRSTLWGFALFGAGLITGHYEAVSITKALFKAGETSGAKVAENKPVSSNSATKLDHPVRGSHSSFKPEATAKDNSVSPDFSEVSPPSLPFELTAEEQTQFRAQFREATQAQIHQIETMILSMNENGLPEEDIKAFAEIKKAMEEQLMAEPETPEANTSGDINNDFAASLEQSGMPLDERSKMIEEILSSGEPAHESSWDTNIEPLPPYEQVRGAQ